MGDPLQTGRELNRIHRPKFPTVLFGITVILTLVGIVMQGILFSHMEMVGAENYLRNTILYNGIGLLLILGLLYENYMKLVRFSYGLTALFIAAGLAGGMLGTHIWSGSYHDRYEAVYLLWMFFPVLYALLLYRMRTLSWKVILILDAVYLAAVLLLSKDITCRYDGSFLVIYRNFVPCHQTGHSAGKKEITLFGGGWITGWEKGRPVILPAIFSRNSMAFHCWVGERSVRHYFLPQIKITGHGPCHRRAVQPTLFTAFSCGLVSLWEYW